MLIVTESWLPSTNGVAHSVAQVIDHLAARGTELVLVAPGASEAPAGVGSVMTTPSIHVGHLGYSTSVPTPGLAAFIARARPDVVHVASPFLLGAQAVRACHRLGIPVVAVYQTDVAAFAASNGYGMMSQAAWRWMAAVHARATLTLACSDSAARDLRARGVPRVRRWTRGVDLDQFSPARRSLTARRELAQGRDMPVVGYMGRLAPEKQLDLLDDLALSPDTAMAFIGEGPLRQELEARFPRATFTGALSGVELATAVASLDVFVHPGANETLCQAAIQALACGVPCVVADAGGVRELLSPGITGERFRPGDGVDLADAVARVLAQDRGPLSEAARVASLARGLDASIDELTGYYLDAIRMHHRGAAA